MPITKLRPSSTFTLERLAQLEAVVPEAFADGMVNWDVLRDAMGESLEDESPGAEHFGLFWPGKREARRLAAMPSKGTIVPVPGEGINEETTRSIYIEGDNLEVLKIIEKSYAGRVKMIYIDPPYNTGNDLLYKDDFKDGLADYLRKTGRIGGEGEVLSTNTRADGRYHSNWLNMMMPRLLLARNLLDPSSGVLFVSIDDHEVHHLRLLLNEVFGEESFAAQITIQTNPKGRVLSEHFAQTHDYLLVYAPSSSPRFTMEKSEEQVIVEYPESDARGRYRLLELRNTHRQFNRKTRPNLFYSLFINPAEGSVWLEPKAPLVEVTPLWEDGLEGCWTWSREKVQRQRDDLVSRRVGANWRVYRKAYGTGTEGQSVHKKAKTIWLDKEYQTEKGQAAFDELIPGRVFVAPKPVELIKTMARLACDKDDLIMDFFSGSCTTAQAVLELNDEDNGHRRFIMVQVPEPTEDGSAARQAGYETISEIGKERIRRVVARLQDRGPEREGIEPTSEGLDRGFRVFHLAPSSYETWDAISGDRVGDLETLFDRFESPLVENWKEEALTTEVMLLQGFPLDSHLALQAQFSKNKVLMIESDACGHRLFICMDNKLSEETIKTLKLNPVDVFVCLDSALSDQAKSRLADICNLNVI